MRPSKEDLEEFIRKGLVQREIAMKYGVDRTTISDWLAHYGLSPGRGNHRSNLKKEKNPNWKGLDASYFAFHIRIRSERGAPRLCEGCGKDDPTKRYEWANIEGRFWDTADYKRLCVPCHRAFDARRRISQCPKGHPYTADNTYIHPQRGSRHCKQCIRTYGVNRRRIKAAAKK